ncbi:hypothetical protein GW835_02670 [archaeon]|nr:hypothetical protein [archaeon]NCP79446.1 hypothetical protein [archaeon]NCP97389.1 hypothetical protein [archaeon]NCQ07213.1 hypothetical protein [archaeon]NCQ51009.1 hypothetical protein [archaeon]
MKNKSNLFLGIIILVLALLVVGLVINQNILKNKIIDDNQDEYLSDQSTEKNYENLTYSDFKTNEESPFVTITSQELLTLLTTTNSSNSIRVGDMSKTMEESMPIMATDSSVQSTGAENDFSQTNVQVSGIDEGDIVKTNGKQIFIAKDKTITVINDVDVPIADEEKYTVKINDQNAEYLTIKGMFLDTEDLLYVIIEKNIVESKFTQYSYLYPQMTYIPFTVVETYRIEENSLSKLNSVEIKGNYYQSRMKDGIVYIITNDYLYDFNPNIYYDRFIMPVKEIKNDVVSNFESKIIMPRDVSEESKVMYNLTSLNYLEKESSIIDSIEIILDNSNTIYMSNNNLYVVTEKNMYYPFFRFGWNNYSKDLVFESIYEKVYPTNIAKEIESNLNDSEKLIEILNNYYQTLDKEEKEELYNLIQEESDKYYQEERNQYDKTYINRIELLLDGSFGSISQGEVKGKLLNQFSLDEEEGYLRVATTYQDYNGYSTISKNAVTVLNSSLNEVGIVDEIAPNERIYSARFMGDKLYLVTYRQVDPFFVIDLENPTKPKVLGYLKISGYSDYLHPISENLILGIGQETEANEWGGTNNSGVKVALFDVSDFSNPKEVGKWVSSASYSNTQVSYDHKAFLYISKNNLVVLPITERYNTSSSEFGFVVLKADKDGISKITTIDHTKKNRYYYGSIARSLYIGDELYTITNNLLKTYNFTSQEETEVVIGEDISYIDETYR